MGEWLVVTNLSKSYGVSRFLFFKKKRDIIKNISFSFKKDSVAILGESGSGKTTLIKMLSGIEKPSSGDIKLNVTQSPKKKNPISMIFQDYWSAINPRFTVYEALKETMNETDEKKMLDEMTNILKKVGLSADVLYKKATEMSGGQIQRICIARSLLSRTQVLIFDESFSSLDLIVVDQLLDLLMELRKEYKLKYVFVTHSLELATYFCEELLVLKDGEVEESLLVSNLMHSNSVYVKELIKAQI